MPWLINAAQADKFRKSQKSLIILDASLHLPATGRDAKQEFLDKHIIDAQFFDINVFSDTTLNLPNMLIQDEKVLSEKLGAFGIRNDYKIIFYDNSDLHSACRAAWIMKMVGHNPHLLYVLDGGLAAWEKYIGKVESGKSKITPKIYRATYQSSHVRSLAQMKHNLHFPQEQVLDVRHAARFAGGTEVRPAMRNGHIPGSFSFPYSSFFNADGTFKSLDKIRSLLTSIAIDFKSPIVATCGAGITASILDFTLDLLGHKQHAIYDGSWAEWGSETLYPGETSLEERPVETCIEEDCPENVCD